MIRLITIMSCVGFILTMLGCQSGGTVLYFTSDRDGNLEIYSTIPNSGEEINVTNKPEDEYAPSLSPDGKWIAFLVGDKEKSSISALMRFSNLSSNPSTNPTSRSAERARNVTIVQAMAM